MKKTLKEFDVAFSGLKIGKHEFEFQVGKRFFEEFDCTEFDDAEVSIDLLLNKTSTFLELEFVFKGKVFLECDVCTDLFWLNINGQKKVVVKFGDEFNDDEDELIVIPRSDSFVNVAQIIYEQTILSLPTRRVHPEGECNEEMIAAINKYRANEPKEQNNPAWDKLKNFYN